jgi:hypothetical protein
MTEEHRLVLLGAFISFIGIFVGAAAAAKMPWWGDLIAAFALTVAMLMVIPKIHVKDKERK